MNNDLSSFLKEIIKEKYDFDLKEIKLETPPKKEFGDYAFGGFNLSKELRKNPNLIVSELKEIIETKINNDFFISKVSIEGPYLNFTLNKSIYTNLFIDFLSKIDSDLSKHGEGKSILIDYIGANVGKPLHIGHMCTPNQGQAIYNVYKKLGYDVIGDNHWGDWGIIFGKLIFAYEKWGNEEKLKENAVEHLLELYIKVTEETELDKTLEEQFRLVFKKLSSGDLHYIEFWKKFTSYSIKSVNIQLNRLNVKPDINIGESFYEGLNLPKIEKIPDLKYNMKDIVLELIEKGIATKNEDLSVGVVFPDNVKIPSCILQKRDGTHGYLASDLCAIKYRIDNFNSEKIIYFTDSRQQLHFKQAFEIAKMSGWLKKENREVELFHAYNGFITLKEGAMSTRKGRIIKLDKLLDESEKRAKDIILEKRNDLTEEELQKLSKIIGIGAIKYGYLKKSRETDVTFDWDEFMTFEGNSGPYIQYAYVRAINIIKNSQIDVSKLSINGNFNLEDELNLVKELLNYENILLETSKMNMPHILAGYSYNLTKVFNSFYNSIHIISEVDENLKNNRLILVQKFSEILKECFNLLGIEMPEKM